MSKISKLIYGKGGLKKKGRTHPDPLINRIVDDIFEELNIINDSVNLKSGTFTAIPSEGKDGDIRLYKGTGYDGNDGYFLQGKFKDGWATVSLTLEQKNLTGTNISDSSSLSVIEEGYALLSDVSYSRLDTNLSVGWGLNQLAPGQWGGKELHDHWSNNEDPGSDHHNHIHFLLGGTPHPIKAGDTAVAGSSGRAADLDHQHAIEVEAPQNDSVNVSASTLGVRDTFAKSDHTHNLDEDIAPTWQGLHTWNREDEDALNIVGHVNIDGNLNVEYSASSTSNVTMTQDVELNTAGSPTTTTTQIWGDTQFGDDTVGGGREVTIKSYGEAIFYGSEDSKPDVKIETAGAYLQLRGSDSSHRSEFKLGSSGNALIQSVGNIQLLPNSSIDGESLSDTNALEGSVLPKGTRITDMGAFNRLWRTGYFAEIYAETLVAQDVLATIGGRIMVAPTTIIEETLTSSSDTLKTAHNNLFPGDICLLKAAPAGLPCQEYIQITSGPTWTDFGEISTIAAATNTAGYTAFEYPDHNLKIKITLSATPSPAIEDGDFVIISGTGGNALDEKGYDGAFKVAKKEKQAITDPDTDLLDKATATTFFLSCPFVDGNVSGGTVKGPPFEYRIVRNLDNTLPNQWNIGDAVANLGYKEGDGYIDLTSTRTIHNQLGPQMAIFARAGTNLITNGDFESNITDGWTASAGISHNTNTTHVYTGSGSAKLARGSESSSDIKMHTDAFGTAVVDDVYIVELWAKSTATDSTDSKKAYLSLSDTISGTADFEVINPSDGLFTDCDSSNTQVEISGSTWQRVTWYCKCSSVSEGTNIRFVIWHGEEDNDATVNIASSDIYIDKVSVHKNPKLNPGSGEESIYGSSIIGLGNLNNYVDYNTDSLDYFGLAIGKNLESDPSAGFKGITADQANGVRLFNTDLSLYDGATKQVELKTGGGTGGTSPEFWIGQEDSDTKKVFQVVKTGTAGTEDDWEVIIRGGNLSVRTDAGDSSTELNINNANVSWANVASTLPNYLDGAGGVQGVHIDDNIVGFYQAGSTAGWPVVIANNDSKGKFWLGPPWDPDASTDPSTGVTGNFLYWDGENLKIKGQVSILGTSTVYDGSQLDSMVGDITDASELAQDGVDDASDANDLATNAISYINNSGVVLNHLITSTVTPSSGYTQTRNYAIITVVSSYTKSFTPTTVNGVDLFGSCWIHVKAQHTDGIGQDKFDIKISDDGGATYTTIVNDYNVSSSPEWVTVQQTLEKDTQYTIKLSSSNVEIYRVYGLVITANAAADPESIYYSKYVANLMEGGVSLSDSIDMGSGNITIGNTSNSYLATFGKVSSDGTYKNNPGIYLGNSYRQDNTYNFDLSIGDYSDSTQSSLNFDGDSGQLEIKNGTISLDNTNVDVIIGQNIIDQGDSHDDILIGTWNAQQESSPAGHGLLVKHSTVRDDTAGEGTGTGKYDYTKIHKGGLNRAGFDYPIYIGSLPLVSGWASEYDENTPSYNEHIGGGVKSNKIFDNMSYVGVNGNGTPTARPMKNASSEDYLDITGGVVPEGRCLIIQAERTHFQWPSNRWLLGTYGGISSHPDSNQAGPILGHNWLWTGYMRLNWNLQNSGSYFDSAAYKNGSWRGCYVATDAEQVTHWRKGIAMLGGDGLGSSTNDGSYWFNNIIPPGTNIANLRFFDLPYFFDDRDNLTYCDPIYNNITVWESDYNGVMDNTRDMFAASQSFVGSFTTYSLSSPI